jgi:hypothetical protein
MESDLTVRSARKYAVLVAKFRQRFPDRPLQECMPRAIHALLNRILPKDSFERQRLDAIFSADSSSDDAVEFCCRCVSLETGIEPEDGARYLHQAECVQEELARHGLREQSPWLARLRSSLANQPPAPAMKPIAPGLATLGDSGDRLTVPRFPNAGNWTGFTLLSAVALAFAVYGHWKIALIPMAVGLLSLLTRVNYWVFDRKEDRLTFAIRNPLFPPRDMMGYSLRDLIGVTLETRTNDEGGKDFAVRVVFAKRQSLVVSRQPRDADRIAAFLGIEKTVKKI